MKQASFPAPRGAVAQWVVLFSLVNVAVSAVIHQPAHVWFAATLSNKMQKQQLTIMLLLVRVPTAYPITTGVFTDCRAIRCL